MVIKASPAKTDGRRKKSEAHPTLNGAFRHSKLPCQFILANVVRKKPGSLVLRCPDMACDRIGHPSVSIVTHWTPGVGDKLKYGEGA